jgi:hypothetical protein
MFDTAEDQIFNIYCDESCHLEHDGFGVMVMGALYSTKQAARSVSKRLRELKQEHGLPADFEVKWSKVSPAKLSFYSSLVEEFLDNPELHFRALVVPDKTKLKHEAFGQSHDEFYYKMYYQLIWVILDPKARYRIFVDIKDTHTGQRLRKLHDVLCNKMYDFNQDIIKRVGGVHSDQVELIQLTDLLTGAVAYANRQLNSSTAKTGIIEQIRARTGYSLVRTTLLREQKFNIFRWQAQ